PARRKARWARASCEDGDPGRCKEGGPPARVRPGGRVGRCVASATDGAHSALGLAEPGAVDEVPRLLAVDRRAQQVGDRLVARPAAQRAAEVVLGEREKAGADLAV